MDRGRDGCLVWRTQWDRTMDVEWGRNSAEDEKIISMLKVKDENALKLIQMRYGNYCRTIAPEIDREDYEECLNDMLMCVWMAAPVEEMRSLKNYVAAVFRRLVINKLKATRCAKRGGGVLDIPLEEAERYFDIRDSADSGLMAQAVAALVDEFLRGVTKRARVMFLLRFFYLHSIKSIAETFSVSESTVKTTLYRTKESLRGYLKAHDVEV